MRVQPRAQLSRVKSGQLQILCRRLRADSGPEVLPAELVHPGLSAATVAARRASFRAASSSPDSEKTALRSINGICIVRVFRKTAVQNWQCMVTLPVFDKLFQLRENFRSLLPYWQRKSRALLTTASLHLFPCGKRPKRSQEKGLP